MTEAPKRGRPRKTAQVEGAVSEFLANPPVGNLRAAVSDPVPGDNGKALARIVAFFKEQHPEHWEALRLCPLQHGVEEMAALLDG